MSDIPKTIEHSFHRHLSLLIYQVNLLKYMHV